MGSWPRASFCVVTTRIRITSLSVLPTQPSVYEAFRSDPSVLAFNLSSHGHPSICILFSCRFTSYTTWINKRQGGKIWCTKKPAHHVRLWKSRQEIELEKEYYWLQYWEEGASMRANGTRERLNYFFGFSNFIFVFLKSFREELQQIHWYSILV